MSEPAEPHVSVSAVLTILTILLIGPLFYACKHVWKRSRTAKRRKSKGAKLADEAGFHGQKELVAMKEREQVSSAEYLLGLIGYAIGIGNVWRFPYMVGKYGGGAFVLAYVVCLVLVAAPLYLMELVMGQFTKKTTIHCFGMIRPRWRSIGYAQALMLFYVLAYYNVLIAYALVYIASSTVEPLPWANAASAGHLAELEAAGIEAHGNLSAAELFWQQRVLHSFESLEDNGGLGLGEVQGQLAGALFAVWLMVFLSLVFGKAILAKVTWVTVVLPCVLLLVLLFNVVALPGAADGIAFYIGKFDAQRLGDLEIWAAALGQILFSLSPGMGTAITMSSYAKPNEDVLRVCLVVVISNSLFSFVGGFAIFSILGNLALTTGREVAEVASKSGTGLAFISLAEGILSFGAGANVMSVLFFVILLFLGLDSTFAWAETAVCYVQDLLAAANRPQPKWKIVGAVCTFLFLGGLPFCTRAGNQLLDVVDRFGVSYYLLLGCFLESCMFNLDFKWERLAYAVRAATRGNRATPTGRQIQPAPFWRMTYLVSVPCLTLFLFVYIFVQDLSSPYGGYPAGFQAVGWLILTSLLALTPLTLWQRAPGTLPPLRARELAALDAESKMRRISSDRISRGLDDGMTLSIEGGGVDGGEGGIAMAGAPLGGAGGAGTQDGGAEGGAPAEAPADGALRPASPRSASPSPQPPSSPEEDEDKPPEKPPPPDLEQQLV